MNDEVATIKDLNEYSYFRTEMDKNRIPMVDVPEVIRSMNGLRQQGYDANSIVSKLSNFEELQIVEKELKDSVELLTKKKDIPEKECGFLESEMDVHSQVISKFKELERMGFELKVQKLLWHKVREIGDANYIEPDKAVQKFMKDVEEQYDDMLGFGSRIQNLKSEIQKNEQVQFQLSAATAMLNSFIIAQFEDPKYVKLR
ncbi:MAG: hypothetical protein WCF23_03300 [Candidatus Nitrosopolaris sp.]